MLPPGPLAFGLIRLKGAEPWTPQGQDLRFLFPKEGAGRYVSASASMGFSSGDVVVIHGAKPGEIRALNGQELVFATFAISPEHLFPLFTANELRLLKRVTDNLKGVKLYEASTPTAVSCHRLIGEVPARLNLEHRSHLLRIATIVLAHEFRAAETDAGGFGGNEDRIDRVLGALSMEDLLMLSVGALARRFGCSPRHLNRLFHQYFGFSVTALRMELRLLKSVALLRDPDAKVSSIAGQCGFNHLGRFNGRFKRRFGTSPSQWRQSTARPKRILLAASHADFECPFDSLGLCPWVGRSSRAKLTNEERLRTMNGFSGKLLITLRAINQSEMDPVAVGGLPSAAPSGLNLFPHA